MEAAIKNYRSARHHQTDNYMIVVVPGYESKDKSKELVGKTAVWKTSGGKEIKGKITATHGNSGAVRILFERGMPGQSLGTKVSIS